MCHFDILDKNLEFKLFHISAFQLHTLNNGYLTADLSLNSLLHLFK